MGSEIAIGGLQNAPNRPQNAINRVYPAISPPGGSKLVVLRGSRLDLTKVRSTQLKYIFKALFRDTPLAHSFCNSGSRWQVARWPGGQATGGRWHEKIIGKWGIPEKSFENVAQLR